MRIYLARHVNGYNAKAASIDTFLTLIPGNYDTVVQAWDNCGGVAKTEVKITVTAKDLKPVRFIYVSSTSKLFGFTVDPATGIPSPTPQVSVPTSGGYRVASDKGGYRLYATTGVNGQLASGLYAYFIDRRNGALTPVPGSPYATTLHTGAIAVRPSGKFVFVATLSAPSGDGVLVYRVNGDGSLTLLNTSPIPTMGTIDSLVVDHYGQYLYAVSSTTNSIDAFSIDVNSGALTPVPGSPYTVSTPGCDAQPMDIDESYGRFLYVADFGASEISGYAISGKTGTLTELSGSPFPYNEGCGGNTDFAHPRTLTTDPTGRSLFIGGDILELQTIDAGNGFAARRTNNFDRPTRLRSDPSGQFVFGVTSTDLSAWVIYSGGFYSYTGSAFTIEPGGNPVVWDLAVTP
jgi:hypothetical protein